MNAKAISVLLDLFYDRLTPELCSRHFCYVCLFAFEDHFYKIFFLQDIMNLLHLCYKKNHGMFDFVYICQAYGSDLIPFVGRWQQK